MSETRDRLERAVSAFLRYRTEGGGDRESFLVAHDDLRDLLEPMLSEELDPEPIRDTVLGGDFRLEHEIGRGGSGVVFAARQRSLGRHVAIKVLPRHVTLAPSTITRFRREARTLATLTHPGIVRVLAVGADRDVHWFAMELIEGRSLAAFLDERLAAADSPAPWTRRMVQLAADVADALQHVHELGIVHRDVKPSNVMLRADLSPVLMDFGLAHDDRTPSITLPGARAGTPCYMAPERIRDASDGADARSDVFALGATLYEMLTFERAFEGSSPHASMRRVVDEEPVDPRTRNPAISRDLAAVLSAALEKDPRRRYQTAADLARDLRATLEHRPVGVRRPSTLARGLRWARRQPVTAAAFGAVLSLLIFLAIGGPILAIHFRRTADEARQAADAERTARELAHERVAETAAVLEFVENRILAAARPAGQTGGLGRGATVRDAVSAALPFVESGFVGRPLIEARLRLTLGTSFYYLGDGEQAAEQNERAHALYAAHLGPDDPATLRSLNNLATSYDMLGRYGEALELRQKTLEGRRATLGPKHPDTVASLNNLAISYERHSRHAEALALRREVLALDGENHGPDHPDTLRSLSNLANSLSALGSFEEACELHLRAFERRKTLLGPDHPDTLLSMMNLGSAYANLDRDEEALALRQHVLEKQEGELGEDHPHTLVSMNNLAVSLAAVGRHAEALELRQRSLAIREAKRGPDHPETLQSRFSLALSYADLGRHQEALDLHRATLELRRSKLASGHTDVYRSLGEIASNLVHLGRGAEALPILDECVRDGAARVGDRAWVSRLMELRLRHFERTRDVAGCRATAEAWERLGRTHPLDLLLAARLRAVTARLAGEAPGPELLGEADAQAALAIEWLRQAVEAGFRDVDDLAEDGDFVSLRERADFRDVRTSTHGRPIVRSEGSR